MALQWSKPSQTCTFSFSCTMCSANTFSAAGATECSKCNELTEYAGIANFFLSQNCFLSKKYVKDNLLLKNHFAVVCLVAWPLNESEVGIDLVLIETSLFLCKVLSITMRTASVT